MPHADRLAPALAMPEHCDGDRFDRTHALSVLQMRTAFRDVGVIDASLSVPRECHNSCTNLTKRGKRPTKSGELPRNESFCRTTKHPLESTEPRTPAKSGEHHCADLNPHSLGSSPSGGTEKGLFRRGLTLADVRGAEDLPAYYRRVARCTLR